MYWRYQTKLKVILIVFAVIILGSDALAQKYQPKVDNFLFLYDATSSMDEIYKKKSKKKAVLAIEAMQSINQDIPELNFQSGLYTVVPSFKTHQVMHPYDTNKFEFAISQIQLPARHIGPQTPLAEGLAQLRPVLNDLSGSTAVILFSDGGENKGGSPAKVLEKLYRQFDLCFHFVSYANTDQEKDFIESMQGLKDCSQRITGVAVQDQQPRKDFVRKIFFSIVRDSDGDGVPDYLDKCPDTPKDLVVDKFGCPVPKRITLDIKFDFDKSKVKPKYQDELKKVADFLKKRPQVNIVVEGHTDSIGTEKYNQKLSHRRAASVKEYLVENFDISPKRISTKAYGETQPIADNDNPAGRQKNRRVEGVFPKIYQKK